MSNHEWHKGSSTDPQLSTDIVSNGKSFVS
jgi:hypothetical protein